VYRNFLTDVRENTEIAQLPKSKSFIQPKIPEIPDRKSTAREIFRINVIIPLFKLIAELPRAKRASGAPWVRKIGKPSGRENLVMTSPYERTSFVRPSVQTIGEGRGFSW